MSRLPSKGAIRKEFVRTTKQTKIVVKSIRYADFIGAKPLRYVPQKKGQSDTKTATVTPIRNV